MTTYETDVREKASALKDAITSARAAGYYIHFPTRADDLDKIGISETSRVGAVTKRPGEEYDAMSKVALVELATARGINLPASATKADVIAALRSSPAGVSTVPTQPVT